MNKKLLIVSCAMALTTAMTLTSCSSDDSFFEQETTTQTPSVETHPLTLTLGIDKGAQTRVTATETGSGLKLSWERGDKVYLRTSTDNGATYSAYFTFLADEIAEDAATASFTCAEFAMPDGTNAVQYVYTSRSVSEMANLDASAQELATQSDATTTNILSHLYMSSPVVAVASEEELKNVKTTVSHANSILNIKLSKGDVVWGSSENVAPSVITLRLVSTSATLLGTADNTVTLNNSQQWDSEGKINTNAVLCISGTMAAADYWVFTATDELGNKLITRTASAKALAPGKRYNAPIAFATADYFPWIDDYATLRIGDNGTNMLDWSSKTLQTCVYGAIGWEFSAEQPLNLSNYKYMVFDVKSGHDKGTQWRLSNHGFWGDTHSEYTIDSPVTVFDLDAQEYFDKSQNVDKSKIVMACFWGYGGEDHAVTFNKIYLTNTKPDTPDTPDPDVPEDGDGSGSITGDEIEDDGDAW